MRSLILGGTKGLGQALAAESVRRMVTPIVVGRSAERARSDPGLAGCELVAADLSDPRALLSVMQPDWQDIGYVFWVAGIFLRKPLTHCTIEEVAAMTATHFTGPIGALTWFHHLMQNARPLADPPGQPYHLTVIASTSSWRMREHESVYCALKAAKAHLTRQYARELVADLPGSLVTLVNPGGIKTPDFWGATGQDIGAFMEPEALAKVIWNLVLLQTAPFAEIQILRGPDGSPRVEGGPRLPEQPF